MSVAIAHRTVDIAVHITGREKPSGDVVPRRHDVRGSDKILRLDYSLMGETSPLLSPLSIAYSFDDKTCAYRYDWLMGITTPNASWNWQGEIRENRAVAVQLLMKAGNSGCGVSEVSAVLLTLPPSRDTSSWLDKHADRLGESLAQASAAARPLSTTAASIIQLSSVMSNFVTSGEKDAKNWFIYRFLDERTNCCAIEWNLHKGVLAQYGPLLRGSVLLTFHGVRRGGDPITMQLMPRVSFGGPNEIDFLPPLEQLDTEETRVVLSIEPIEPEVTGVWR